MISLNSTLMASQSDAILLLFSHVMYSFRYVELWNNVDGVLEMGHTDFSCHDTARSSYNHQP